MSKLSILAVLAALVPGQSFASCVAAGLVSAESEVARKVTIMNMSNTETLKLYWISFSGAPTHYADIAPNTQLVQPTFDGHAWAVEGSDGTCKTLVLAQASDIDVVVR